MKEVIDGLKCNATNGKESFCMISEKQLNAMKELAKRDEQELKQKQDTIDKAREYVNNTIDYYLDHMEEIPYSLSQLSSILGDKDE